MRSRTTSVYIRLNGEESGKIGRSAEYIFTKEYYKVMKTLPNLTDFNSVNEYFLSEYGFSLFLIEEPYLMMRKRRVAKWVGASDPHITLLKRNGKPTTKYPRSYGIIENGGFRPISLGTLISNLKEERPLFSRV